MNLPYPLILASNSPRRQEILSQAGFEFRTVVRPVEEIYPEELDPVSIALFIAEQKMKAYDDLARSNIILCADTIVIQNGIILGKPQNLDQAREMLMKLSGKEHEVVTAVVIKSPKQIKTFAESTSVLFEQLESEEIDHYINNFKPLDKAGSYGIQEWIGLIGIREIHGSYFNVVGLPVHRVYQELKSLFH